MIFLNESLGAFAAQYKIATEIASMAYDMLTKSVLNNVFDTENDTVKKVNLKLKLNTPYYDFKGVVENISENGTLFVRIDVPAHCRHLKRKDWIINRIATVLTHELMHGNIFLKRFSNDEEINDMSMYYPNFLAMMQNEKEGTPLHSVGRALYSTYYQEVQAFVSQTAIDIKNMFGGKLKYTNEEIKEGILSSESYNIYMNNINGIFKDVCEMDDETLYELILKPMTERYDIQWSLKECKKEFKKALTISKNAINQIIRNAMLLTINPKLEF